MSVCFWCIWLGMVVDYSLYVCYLWLFVLLLDLGFVWLIFVGDLLFIVCVNCCCDVMLWFWLFGLNWCSSRWFWGLLILVLLVFCLFWLHVVCWLVIYQFMLGFDCICCLLVVCLWWVFWDLWVLVVLCLIYLRLFAWFLVGLCFSMFNVIVCVLFGFINSVISAICFICCCNLLLTFCVVAFGVCCLLFGLFPDVDLDLNLLKLLVCALHIVWVGCSWYLIEWASYFVALDLLVWWMFVLAIAWFLFLVLIVLCLFSCGGCSFGLLLFAAFILLWIAVFV